MNCEKCKKLINSGDEMTYHRKTMCEDCYIDTLSPTRTCDPWVVYTAKSFSGNDAIFNTTQTKILKILEETGGVEIAGLAEMLQMTSGDVEREFATLRHMEKARAAWQNGKKVLCLW